MTSYVQPPPPPRYEPPPVAISDPYREYGPPRYSPGFGPGAPPPTPPNQPPGQPPNGPGMEDISGLPAHIRGGMTRGQNGELVYNNQRVSLGTDGTFRYDPTPFNPAAWQWGDYGSPMDNYQGGFGRNPVTGMNQFNGRPIAADPLAPDSAGANSWMQRFMPWWDAQRAGRFTPPPSTGGGDQGFWQPNGGKIGYQQPDGGTQTPPGGSGLGRGDGPPNLGPPGGAPSYGPGSPTPGAVTPPPGGNTTRNPLWRDPSGGIPWMPPGAGPIGGGPSTPWRPPTTGQPPPGTPPPPGNPPPPGGGPDPNNPPPGGPPYTTPPPMGPGWPGIPGWGDQGRGEGRGFNRTGIDPRMDRLYEWGLNEATARYGDPAGRTFYGGETVAGLTPDEIQAQQMLRDSGVELGGMGKGNADYISTMQGRALNPQDDPTLNAAVTAAMTDMKQQALDPGGVFSTIRGNSLMNGSFGGSRQGVMEGVAAGRVAQAMGKTAADMRLAGRTENLRAADQAMGHIPNVSNLLTAPGSMYSAVGAQNRAQDQRVKDDNLRRWAYDTFEPDRRLDSMFSRFGQANLGNWQSGQQYMSPIGMDALEEGVSQGPSGMQNALGILGLLGAGWNMLNQ